MRQNKQLIRDSIQAVWVKGDLSALPDFWVEDCINHAAPPPGDRGLDALRAYHAAFFAQFAAFSEVEINIQSQIAEGDRVVTQMLMRGRHTEEFLGVPPTGKAVSLSTIRIDELRNGKIAQHWSVADLLGLMQQIQ